MKKILFTDLDGSLLDLKSYSYFKSEAAVNRLKQARVPIVFCSSKTRCEQLFYQDALGLQHPFITENGSAIFIPRRYFKRKIPYHTFITDEFEVISLGKNVADIRAFLETYRNEFEQKFTCFADIPPEEVSMLTGLDVRSAKRAMLRDYSETILSGSVSRVFYNALELEGLRSIKGSKFETIVGAKVNKGVAVQILIDLYEREFDQIRTFGIGDSINDIEMLKVVDDAYLVQRPDDTWSAVEMAELKKMIGVGPEGWSKVAEIIHSFR